MQKTLLALALAAAALPSQAVTITDWNFNNSALTASTGVGTAKLVGGTTTTNVTSTGISGAAATDKAWQTTSYAAATVGNKTSGVQFDVSTKGFENLFLSYDLRHSNSSSRYEQVQYSLDGVSFVDLKSFDADAGGDKWYSRTLDLSQIAGVNDNSKFAVRVVSTFAPNTSAYAGTTSGTNYATSGTWRFDNVTFTGTAVTAVPEPQTYAMLLAGLGAIGFVARRRAAK